MLQFKGIKKDKFRIDNDQPHQAAIAVSDDLKKSLDTDTKVAATEFSANKSLGELYFGLQLLTGSYETKNSKSDNSETTQDLSQNDGNNNNSRVSATSAYSLEDFQELDEAQTQRSYSKEDSFLFAEHSKSFESESGFKEIYQKHKDNFSIDANRADYTIEYSYVDSNQGIIKVKENWQRPEKNDHHAFSQFMKKFMFFPNLDAEAQEMIECQVYRLNREVINAALAMLANNYQFDGKLHPLFRINVPPSPDAKMTYIRKDHCFTLKLVTPIKSFYDEAGAIYSLDFTETTIPSSIERDDEALDICTLTFVAVLDFTQFLESKQDIKASIDIKVSTANTLLQYVGPLNSPYVKQIQTQAKATILDSEKTVPLTRTVSPPLLNNKIISIQYYLRNTANINFDSILSALKEIGESSEISSKHLPNIFFALEALFKQALITRLLKHQANSLYRDINKHDNRLEDLNFAFNLNKLLVKWLAKKHSFSNLLNGMKYEFSNVFCHFAIPRNIMPLMNVLHGKLMKQVQASAYFIHKNPKKYDGVKFANFLFMTLLDHTQTALQEASKVMQVEVLGYDLRKAQFSNENLLEPTYLKWLTEVNEAPETQQESSVFFQLKNIQAIHQEILSEARTSHKTTPFRESAKSSRKPNRHTNLNLAATQPVLLLDKEPLTIEQRRILALQLPRKVCKTVCVGKPSENFAALLKLNPFLGSLFTGASVRYTAVQLSKLFVGGVAVPYFIIPEVLAAGAGFGMGYFAIVKPTFPMKTGLRMVEVFSKSCLVFIGTMNITIDAYLIVNGNNSSSDLLLLKILPAPVISTLLYGTWNLIPYSKKQDWSDHRLSSKYLVNSANIFCKTLLYDGVLTFGILVVFNRPGSLVNLLVPPIPAFVAALLTQDQSPVREKVALLMRLTTAGILITLIVKDAVNQQPPMWLSISRQVMWGLSLLAGFGIILLNRVNFMRKYDGPPKVVAKLEQIENHPEIPQQVDEQTPLLSDRLKQAIEANQWNSTSVADQEQTVRQLQTVLHQFPSIQQGENIDNSKKSRTCCQRLRDSRCTIL